MPLSKQSNQEILRKTKLFGDYEFYCEIVDSHIYSEHGLFIYVSIYLSICLTQESLKYVYFSSCTVDWGKRQAEDERKSYYENLKQEI